MFSPPWLSPYPAYHVTMFVAAYDGQRRTRGTRRESRLLLCEFCGFCVERRAVWRSIGTLLEGHPRGHLQLPRIADPLPEKSVEVEQRGGAQRIHVVGVVERVEHLDAGDDLVPRPDPERALQPPVE